MRAIASNATKFPKHEHDSGLTSPVQVGERQHAKETKQKIKNNDRKKISTTWT
jgi:hypothetical protein